MRAARRGSQWERNHTAQSEWQCVADVAPTLADGYCMPPRQNQSVNFIHDLRRTWASHAVMNGTPLLVVAKNFGHNDTRMVEKHYRHLAPYYVAGTIRAGAPRFGITPDPMIVPLSAAKVHHEA
jgi:hypothetical protein